MVVADLKTSLLLKQYAKWVNEYSFLRWALSIDNSWDFRCLPV